MKKFTKFLSSLAALMLIAFWVSAQMPDAITISPETATSDDQLTITFDPSKACTPSGKNSLTTASKICMHSGYGDIAGTNWQGVVDWDKLGKDNTPTELTKQGNGTWTITITPKTFYGIPEGVIVTKLTMVFNGCDNWASEGKDKDLDNPPNCKDFFVPIKYKSLKPSILFKVNMNKLLKDGKIDPALDKVYVEIQGKKPELMIDVDGSSKTDGIYEVLIEDNIDDSTKYNFKFFYAEDTTVKKTYETINREVNVAPGKNVVDVWFNNEPLAKTTFQLDLSALITAGTFVEGTDFVDVAGSFNGWDGKDHKLTKVGSGLYAVDLTLEPGTTYEYKFRLNGNWATSEFPGGGPNRKFIGLNKDYTVEHLYDNTHPDRWPIKLVCVMKYQLKSGKYDKTKQFLDVAGNFEGWNGGNILYDWDGDSIYSAEVYVDTNNKTMEFKYRFDGDWGTSEFPGGGPNRQFTFKMVNDSFGAWYNNDDPGVAVKPKVNNLKITGTLTVGETLTASYDYEDVNGDAEGTSLMLWLRADDANGTNIAPIAGATSKTYVLTASDHQKYISFVVIPVAATGTPTTLVGDTFRVNVGPIAGVGIDDEAFKHLKIYPNPTTGNLFIENASKLNNIVIVNMLGKTISNITEVKSDIIVVDLSNEPSGVYFIIMNSDNNTLTKRLIKQ